MGDFANWIRRGDIVPAGITPMVVWRCHNRHRILRVFITADGWLVLGEEFRVADSHQRLGLPDEVHVVHNVAEGVNRTLQHDITQWDVRMLEVGCKQCRRYMWAPAEWLIEDCTKVAATRAPLPQPRTVHLLVLN